MFFFSLPIVHHPHVRTINSLDDQKALTAAPIEVGLARFFFLFFAEFVSEKCVIFRTVNRIVVNDCLYAFYTAATFSVEHTNTFSILFIHRHFSFTTTPHKLIHKLSLRHIFFFLILHCSTQKLVSLKTHT